VRGSKHRYQSGSSLLGCINRPGISDLSWGKRNYRCTCVFHQAGFGWGRAWHELVTLWRSCVGLCSPGACSQALCRGTWVHRVSQPVPPGFGHVVNICGLWTGLLESRRTDCQRLVMERWQTSARRGRSARGTLVWMLGCAGGRWCSAGPGGQSRSACSR